MGKSLFPELNKLYGHGYEISALGCSGRVVASASKALNEEAAKIIIWDSDDFKIV